MLDELHSARFIDASPAQVWATLLDEVWSWDITKLKSREVDPLLPLRDPRRLQSLRRRLDRRAPRELRARHGADHPVCEQQQITRDQLTVHADRGPSMTSMPVALLLADLGVTKTHNHTSTDNPYSEAQFKTLKYRPGFPARFDSIEQPAASAASSSPTTTTSIATPGSA